MARSRLLVPAVCVAALLGGAFAPLQKTDQKPDQKSDGLERRVLEYWARRQAKDLPAAYAFYCQQYRSRVSRDQYTQMTRLNRFDMKDLTVADVNPEADAFSVTITYHYMAPMINDRPLDGRSSELWKRDADGSTWCKVDEPTSLPFPRGPRAH